jgi:hypothetical protein
MSALERRPNGTPEGGMSETKSRVPRKGTYGRHTALRNGDCFRGLVSRGKSPTGTARNATRTEGLRRHVTFARLWAGGGLQENGLAGKIPVMGACGFVLDVVDLPH